MTGVEITKLEMPLQKDVSTRGPKLKVGASFDEIEDFSATLKSWSLSAFSTAGAKEKSGTDGQKDAWRFDTAEKWHHLTKTCFDFADLHCILEFVFPCALNESYC